jgi:hypothetical protein
VLNFQDILSPEISFINHLMSKWDKVPFSVLVIESFRNESLYLSTSSSGLAFHYSFKEKEILKYIYKNFPESKKIIKNVKIIVKIT